MKNDPELTSIENDIKRTESALRLLWSLLGIVMLISTIGLIGKMTKEDNDLAESFYCQSVHDGLQDDYNGSYKQGKCPQSEWTVRK